jgi:hypothetical protein
MKVFDDLMKLGGLAFLAGSALSRDTDWPVHDNGLTDLVQW